MKQENQKECQPKPETLEDPDSESQTTSNHLELLLKRMRQRNRARAPSIDWNSMEQLSKCQYLRLHHVSCAEGEEEEWEEGGGDGGAEAADRIKMTSWTLAQTRLLRGPENYVSSMFY
ncbi:hypothetical protein ACOMHN_033299 [Nucella lapillus]